MGGQSGAHYEARERLFGALRFARAFKKRPPYFATPLRGFLGHFSSLVISKKSFAWLLNGLSRRFARGFKKELHLAASRLIAALHFARGVHTASALTAFALTWLSATTLRGLSWHFSSLVVSNKCRLPIWNLNQNSTFLKLEVGFFSNRKSF